MDTNRLPGSVLLPNVNSVSKCHFQQEFYTAPLGFQLKTGLCNLCFQKFMSCCLATKHSYTQIFLLMTDTTLHETSQVFRWGTYDWKFWADCPQVKHLPSKHTCILQFSRPHVCSHCPLLDAAKVSVDTVTWCTNSYSVLYMYSVSFRNCSRGDES